MKTKVLGLSPNALFILQQRYLMRDENREIIETPTQMFRRVAKAIAGIELNYGKDKLFIKKMEKNFFEIMTKMEFLPNSPTLMNAGTNLGQLSACFVLSVEDDIDSIFDAVHYTANIHKSGGGTGFSFSRIRPKGDVVKSTGGIASGPLSFMAVFNSATEVIKQGGKRRGANMGVMRVDHPDIMDFIMAKEREGTLSNFNLSVGVTDKFITAVEKDEDFEFVNPRNKKAVKTIRARAIWNLLCYMSWKNGEPAVIFLDTINKTNPTPEVGEFEATNPCLTGDTLISTTMGKIPISLLAKSRSKEADVYTMENGKLAITRAKNIRATSTQPRDIVEIVTSRGNIKCTPEHKIYTINKGWACAKDLLKGDQLVGLRESRRGAKYVGVSLSTQDKYDSAMEHKLVVEYYYGFINFQRTDIHHINGNTQDNRIINLQLLPHSIHSSYKMFGNKYFKQNDETGRFESKEQLKEKEIINVGSRKTTWFVQEVKSAGKEIVYDMTVSTTENFIANGIVVHNCGETPLLPYESCNLGSINLSKFVKNNGASKIDYDKLRKVVRLAIRFLDNVIDVNKYPLPQIREATLANRKIGLGVMGFADTLIYLGIKYNSEEAISIAEELMRVILDEAVATSIELGKERGSFPNKDKSIYKDKPYMRNATLTTIAPTGTISIIANCSYGIEPMFAIVQRRKVKETLGKDLIEVNPAVKRSLELKGLWNNEMEKALIVSQCKNCVVLPEDMKKAFVTSAEISPEAHLRMQAAFQKYTHNAVSKTINLPNTSSVRDIEEIYLLAHKLGIKGVTIYRDGSRTYQLLIKEDGTCQTCPS